ncbi:MAG: hypothetical protein IJ111_11790 [Eggerthellaceae bacterium]|nr:hypothetical protein [Eggerthellaceae bacterium]
MQRSGSQKALLVFSVIEIACAAFLIIGGILVVAGAGMVGGGALLGDLTLKGQGKDAILLARAAILLIGLGAWGLLCGIFGIRAANDSRKIMIAWVFLLIGLILNVVGAAWSVLGGSFGQSPALIVMSLVFDIVLFWIADNIKREAAE